MHANAVAGSVALALGVLAPAVLAQQTTVQVWFPMLDVEDEAEASEFFSEVGFEVITTTGNAVVLGPGPRDKSLYKSLDMPTLTAGPNTFHQEYTATYVDTSGSSTWTSTDFLSYDCTFSGCPEATTGSCVGEESRPDVTGGTSSWSYTLTADDLTFYGLPLATPLPTPLKDSCDGDSESEKATESRTGKDAQASGTDDEGDDDESAGWRIAAPFAALVPAVVLGLAM